MSDRQILRAQRRLVEHSASPRDLPHTVDAAKDVLALPTDEIVPAQIAPASEQEEIALDRQLVLSVTR